MATRRTRKRPLERRFEEGPFLSLGMPYAHGGLRNARTVILLFVASYAQREGALYTLAFCTLFLARMVNTLLTGAALRSCIILSPLFLLPIERRLLLLASLHRSTSARFLPFLLTFSPTLSSLHGFPLPFHPLGVPTVWPIQLRAMVLPSIEPIDHSIVLLFVFI